MQVDTMTPKLLKDPDGFEERPLYLSVDCRHPGLLNLQKIRTRSERDKFLAKAWQDSQNRETWDVRVIRVDSSGITEIKLEDQSQLEAKQ